MPAPVRKQVYDLTLADFDVSPVWEFASDEEGVAGQDEATVRPYEVSFPVDAAGHGGPVVRAVFTLADGTNLRGYFSPQPVSLRKPFWLHILAAAGGVPGGGITLSRPPPGGVTCISSVRAALKAGIKPSQIARQFDGHFERLVVVVL
jgi:hypothetical protein